MTTRTTGAPTPERMLTADEAVDVAGEIARMALVDLLPKLIQALDAHWEANLQQSIAAALKDPDGLSSTS